MTDTKKKMKLAYPFDDLCRRFLNVGCIAIEDSDATTRGSPLSHAECVRMLRFLMKLGIRTISTCNEENVVVKEHAVFDFRPLCKGKEYRADRVNLHEIVKLMLVFLPEQMQDEVGFYFAKTAKKTTIDYYLLTGLVRLVEARRRAAASQFQEDCSDWD